MKLAADARRCGILLGEVVLAIVAVSLLVRTSRDGSEAVEAAAGGSCSRIVSMSPSITETLFALGLGERVVGVTRYCNYPPEAKALPQIGGWLDPSYEAIVALRPDLIVTREGSDQSTATLRQLGLDTLVVHHDHLEGILDSFTTIGGRCGADGEAERLVGQIRQKMDEIRQRTASLPRPRVLFVAERTLDSGEIQDLYAAGADGFINRVIELAGGSNVCAETAGGFPVLSAEGILKLNPEVIVDLVPNLPQQPRDRQALLGDWRQLAELDAVRHGRVHVLDDDYAFIPGPRFILLAEKLARLFHPEEDWSRL
ncbi:MAG: cobalamin-binding protein [Rhodopirellula sp.]|nr:cobalamin-binding protein [Rhodopirellula sp.]